MTLTDFLDHVAEHGADAYAQQEVHRRADVWATNPALTDSAVACIRAVRALDDSAARFYAMHRAIGWLPVDHSYAAHWPGRWY